MSFTDYLENKLLDHTFGGAAYTAPATVYVALFTTATNDAGAGTEVTGGSYARQAITVSVTGNAVTTTAAVSFPTASASWGTVTHAALMDAASAGNMLGQDALPTSKIIDSGDVFTIPVGDIDITLD